MTMSISRSILRVRFSGSNQSIRFVWDGECKRYMFPVGPHIYRRGCITSSRPGEYVCIRPLEELGSTKRLTWRSPIATNLLTIRCSGQRMMDTMQKNLVRHRGSCDAMDANDLPLRLKGSERLVGIGIREPRFVLFRSSL